MRGRGGSGGNRKQPNPLTRSYESNGPDVKVRGTAAHIAEKYQQLARDAQASGDRVGAENYLQHAEHYLRLIAAAQAQQAQQQEQASEQQRRDNEQRQGRREANPGNEGGAQGNGAQGNGAQANGNGSAGADDDMGLPAFLRNAARSSSAREETGEDGAPQGEEAAAASGDDAKDDKGKGAKDAQGKDGDEQPARAPRRRRRPAKAEKAEEEAGAEAKPVAAEPSDAAVAEVADNA